MANRIKDLSVTAISPATDDYAVLDGATNGTRKIILGSIVTMAASLVAVTGGSINGTTIGATTPSTGAFTTLTATGTTTLATSLTGSLQASSGVVSAIANTGTGNNVLATSPTLVTPALGTPTSLTLTNAVGLPLSTGVTGTLTNAQLANSSITFGATATSLGGTVSGLNSVTIGATTPSSGAFTTLNASGSIKFSSLTTGTLVSDASGNITSTVSAGGGGISMGKAIAMALVFS